MSQAVLSQHIAAHLGMPGSISQGDAALRNPASADTPEQPVLNARTSRTIIAGSG